MIPIKLVGAAAKTEPRSPAASALQYLQPGALNLAALPPLSLYIHFPVVRAQVSLLRFQFARGARRIPRAGIPRRGAARPGTVAAADLGPQDLHGFHRRRHAEPDVGQGLDQLLSDVRTLLPLEIDAEITMEANPGTFEAEKFKSFRASGVNRLSIGIQSFNADHLKALGRIHDDGEASRAVEIAQANFDNFNLDLMYALPTQTLAEARRDLDTALSFKPPHLSLYHLTMEPNTVFAKFPPVLPDDDASADMQDMIAEVTAGAGFEHYEVSAYAQPGRRAQHNLNYWEFGDYLGIGAGAHSKISFPHRVLRQARFKQPESFINAARAGNPVQEEHEIPRADMGFEFMLNTLRLTEGFSPNLFGERTGMGINAIDGMLNAAEAKGLLYRDHKIIRPTELGQRFLNDLQQMFLGS